MLWQKVIGATAAATEIELSFIGTASDPANQTTYSLSSVAIGTPSANRLVVASVHSSGNSSGSTVTSVTLNGSAMTLAASRANSFGNVGIFYLDVAAGSIADFVVTFSDRKARMQISIYTLTGLSSFNPVDTNTAVGSSTSVSLTLNAPAPSASIFAFTQVSGTQTGSFSSAVETYDSGIASEGTTAIGGFLIDAGSSHTETLTLTGTGNSHCFSGASWS